MKSLKLVMLSAAFAGTCVVEKVSAMSPDDLKWRQEQKAQKDFLTERFESEAAARQDARDQDFEILANDVRFYYNAIQNLNDVNVRNELLQLLEQAKNSKDLRNFIANAGHALNLQQIDDEDAQYGNYLQSVQESENRMIEEYESYLAEQKWNSLINAFKFDEAGTFFTNLLNTIGNERIESDEYAEQQRVEFVNMVNDITVSISNVVQMQALGMMTTVYEAQIQEKLKNIVVYVWNNPVVRVYLDIALVVFHPTTAFGMVMLETMRLTNVVEFIKKSIPVVSIPVVIR